jgi:hypothetical protein
LNFVFHGLLISSLHKEATEIYKPRHGLMVKIRPTSRRRKTLCWFCLESAPPPANVKHRTDRRALISSGRILSISVDVADLVLGATSDLCRDNNQAKPAIFAVSTK